MAMTPVRPAAQSTPVQPAKPRPELKKKRAPLSRRSFLRTTWLASIGAALAGFGAGSVYMLWPNLSKGFGSKISVSKSDVDAAIDADGNFYSPEGRFYVVPYDGDGGETVYKGVTAGGYMALYQRCVHLGCRVPWCGTSHWWECPCHGSQYNQAGEYKLGPAPRGLDRFAVSDEGGNIVVDTGTVITGPPRGTDTTGQQLEGPHCISGGGEGGEGGEA
jgi:cytochrome b6-f complex iron-sulfur subunit